VPASIKEGIRTSDSQGSPHAPYVKGLKKKSGRVCRERGGEILAFKKKIGQELSTSKREKRCCEGEGFAEPTHGTLEDWRLRGGGGDVAGTEQKKEGRGKDRGGGRKGQKEGQNVEKRGQPLEKPWTRKQCQPNCGGT